MSGGKGGSTSSSVTIPEYIEEAARRNLAKAEGISQIGYVPYYGPDVAAFTPFQQAGFQQTADVASAFGMGPQMSQADIMGGMPAPTEFAGGVRGYSAAPLYQQAVDELAAQRPAQAQYIESFFIDPVTGQAGTRVQPAVDYGQFGTMASEREADRANQLAIAQAQAGAGPSTYVQNTTLTPVELSQYASTVGGANYNPQTDVLTPEQAAAVQSATPEGTAARIAQEDIAMNTLGSAGMGTSDVFNNLVFNAEPTFEDPSSTGSYGGSLVTGDVSGATYGIPTVAGNILDDFMPIEDQMARNEQYMAEQMGSVLQPDGSYDISSWYDENGPVAGVAPEPEAEAGLLSDIGNLITSGGITGAALRGVGGALEPAFEAAESGLATLFNDPRTFEERDADRLATEAAMAAMPADESAAVQAQMEAAAIEQEKLKVADPEAFVAQFAQPDQADAVQAVQKAQALSVSPRPPNLTSDKARDWIKANLGINVDKKDATDMIRSLQADWDRQNG